MNTYIRAKSRGHAPALLAAALALATVGGCRTYEAAPFDPLAALRQLDKVSLKKTATDDSRAAKPFSLANGLSATEAATVAVRLNPSLRATRARLGVARAELVEAGLLEDIEIEWTAQDFIAAGAFGETAGDTGFLSNASLMWTLPRIGEIDAKEAVATASIHEVQGDALQAELDVVRDAHLAHVELLAARARLALNRRIEAIWKRVDDFSEKAREQGAATAMQSSLARIALTNVRFAQVGLRNDETQAAQALNAVLGVPPSAKARLEGKLASAGKAPLAPAKTLVATALARRPDLQVLQAQYERAEEELRLEVIRQWPQFSIGTGIGFALPVFRDWNSPAIDTAIARRTVLYQQLEAMIHAIRAEVYAARALAEQTRQEVRFFETELEPRLGEALSASNRAFEAKAVNLFETFVVQNQVTEARRRLLDARARYGQARVRLDAATGTLLPTRRETTPAERSSAQESDR